MQVELNYQGNQRFQAIAGKHAIWIDQSQTTADDSSSMTPPEWFLASLGSCVGFSALKYCQGKGIDTTGMAISVAAHKTEHPNRFDEIVVHISLPVALDEDHYEGLEEAAEACFVYNTLIESPTVNIQITAGFLSASPA